MQAISRNQLKKKMDRHEDFELVEVLDANAYSQFHLPDAINVPLGDDFERHVQQQIPDKSRPVVVYCKDKNCQASPKAGEKLEKLGYQKVFDYVEGKEDWRSAGLPIEA